MATTDSTKFQAYKDERKWNYVFLLYARYGGSFRKLSTVSGISQNELKNWDQQYRDEVMQFIAANRVIRGDEIIDKEAEEKPPTVPELINKILIKLNTAITGESDPANLSRTLQNLHSYESATKAAAADKPKAASTIADAVAKKLKQ